MGITKQVKGRPLTDDEVRNMQEGDQLCMQVTSPKGNVQDRHVMVGRNSGKELVLCLPGYADYTINLSQPDLNDGGSRAFFATEIKRTAEYETEEAALELLEHACGIAENEGMFGVDSYEIAHSEDEGQRPSMLLSISEFGKTITFEITARKLGNEDQIVSPMDVEEENG